MHRLSLALAASVCSAPAARDDVAVDLGPPAEVRAARAAP